MSDEATLDPVGQLVEEFAARCRRGQHPSVTEYVERYPELAERLRQLLPMVAMMEEAGSSEATLTAGVLGSAGEAPQRLGGYQLLREIGRGGMGIVYEAEQIALGRRVALKVLPLHATRTGGLERFHREARAAARLHHTNIVPVFEVGEEGDRCFYAMQYIRGQPLDQVLEELRDLQRKARAESTAKIPPHAEPTVAHSLLSGPPVGRPSKADQDGLRRPSYGATAAVEVSTAAAPQPAPLGLMEALHAHTNVATLPGRADPTSATSDPRNYHRSVAHVGIQVAEALEYAHNEGVVHRDIKPANLLLDTDSRVWVTDFGLAKTDGAGLTHSSDLVGTLRYMAPERFRGWSDPRSDSYSLGLTLYEMLLLRPAFDTMDQAVLVQQLLNHNPPRLRKVDPRIPRDLETIVAKSIEKEPSRRYQTAGEFAEDLKRFLEDRPIAARRSSTMEHSWRWCRRNPVVAGLIAAVVAVTLCGMSGVIWQWREALANARLASGRADQLAVKTQEAEGHARKAAAEEKKAKAERDATLLVNEQLRRANYTAHMNLAQRAWRDHDVQRARELLDLHLPVQQSDLRGFEWHYLDRLCRDHLRQSTKLAAPMYKAAISPDRRRVAAATSAKDVSVYDIATGQRIWGPAPVSATKINKIAFSADGQRLAAVAGGDLKVFDAESGRETFFRPSHDDTWSVAFDPGGKLVAIGTGKGVVNIYSLERGEEAPRALDGHSGAVDSVAFSPDGQFLASGSREGKVILRNAQTWEPLSFSPLKIDESSIWGIAFDSGSHFLVATSLSGRIWSWDISTGKPRFEQPVKAGGTLLNVVFSPDGKQLAAGGWRQSIHLFDAQTGTELAPSPWRAHHGPIHALTFLPDTPRLISAGWDGVVRRWSTQVVAESIPFVECRKSAAMAMSSDGRYLAAVRPQGGVFLVDAESGKSLRDLPGPSLRVPALAFSPDSKRLAGSFADGQVIIWDVANEMPPLTLAMPQADEASRLAFSPDGGILATGALGRTQRVNMLRLWDTRTGKMIRDLPNDPARGGLTTAVWALAFHPSGKRLASSSADGIVRMWDLIKGEELPDFSAEHEAGTGGLAFDPDGTRLACASFDGIVHIRDSQSGKSLAMLHGHKSSVHCVAYSHDGRRMATGSADLTVRIWDTETGQELLALAGHEEMIGAVAFGANDRRLFSYSFDGSLRLWDARPLP